MIYFDNNATTKIFPSVLTRMNEVYALPFNSSAIHCLGQKATAIVEETRRNLQQFLKAENYEVIFTSGATEANNQVLFGSEVEKIFLSKLEHSSVYNCKPQNKKIIEIGLTDAGLINIDELKQKLEKVENGNFLVCVLLAHNETGAIQPISEIAKLVHQKGGLVHCDIAQAPGKIEVNLEQLNVDFVSISAHKFGGPQGVGAVLMRKGLYLNPLIFGGGQEKSQRSGSLNIAGIAGFGEACNLAKENLEKFSKLEELRDFLEREVKEIGGDNVEIFSQDVPRLVNTSFFAIRNCSGETQVIDFDLNGICVSAGSACSSGTLKERRVLQAMQISPEFSGSAIRVSLGLQNNHSEIVEFIKVWKKLFQRVNDVINH